jgi:hypothetical protein
LGSGTSSKHNGSGISLLAIRYLYKDWLDYKRYIESTFDDNYKLKEGFISYLSREGDNLSLIPRKNNH